MSRSSQSVARMSEATCGAEFAAFTGPGYRFAHPGYEPSQCNKSRASALMPRKVSKIARVYDPT